MQTQPPKLPPMAPRTREIFRVVFVFRQKYQHPVNTVEWKPAARK